MNPSEKDLVNGSASACPAVLVAASAGAMASTAVFVVANLTAIAAARPGLLGQWRAKADEGSAHALARAPPAPAPARAPIRAHGLRKKEADPFRVRLAGP